MSRYVRLRRGAVAIPAKEQLDRVLRDSATVADYDASLGVTGTLNASAWANQIGAAGPLLQATGSAQPIVLPYTGEKYAWLPAVASNTLTSPNLVVTGTRTISFTVALNDYTPAADVTLISKSSGNDGFIVKWLTTDKVRLVIGDGTSLTNVDMAAATTLTDGTKHTISIAWADGVGATFSIDGVASAQVAAVKTLTNAAVALTIGSTTSIGKIYSVSVGGLYSFSAADWSETSTNGATATSSTTGEVWTLNNTGAKLAQIVGSASLLLDGVDDLMQATFTLNQPETIYFVGKQVTWTNQRYLFDGGTLNKGVLYQTTTSPTLSLYAGSTVAANTDLAVGVYGVVTVVFNGAASSLKINGATETTGNAGANNMGGFTLGANGNVGAGNFGNIQVKRVILRAAADSAATRAQIQALLKSIYGTP